MTQRGLMLGGQFRYLTDSSSGSIDAEWLAHDREADDRRSLVSWNHASRFGQHWRADVDINHVSDDRYFEDFGRSLDIASTSLLPSSAYLRGQGIGWNASIGGDEFQVTDPTLPGAAEPYRRLPRATFEIDRALVGNLQAGIESEFVAFSKDDALDGQRLDAFPYLAYPVEGAPGSCGPNWAIATPVTSLIAMTTMRPIAACPSQASMPDCASSARSHSATSAIRRRLNRASTICACRIATRMTCRCSIPRKCPSASASCFAATASSAPTAK
jgi:hypothetical protein